MSDRKRPAKRKIDYVVKFNGEIIRRFTSDITYTHAIVTRRDEDSARHEAYEPDAETIEYRRSIFDDYTQEAATLQSGTPGYVDAMGRSRYGMVRVDDKLKAINERIRDGVDAFLERWRQGCIQTFIDRKNIGYFKPSVGQNAWLRPGELATKGEEFFKNGWRGGEGLYLGIVPLETEQSPSIAKSFSKLSKTTQRAILSDVCEKMIARKAWDEIALFLSGQVGDDVATLIKIVRGL